MKWRKHIGLKIVFAVSFSTLIAACSLQRQSALGRHLFVKNKINKTPPCIQDSMQANTTTFAPDSVIKTSGEQKSRVAQTNKPHTNSSVSNSKFYLKKAHTFFSFFPNRFERSTIKDTLQHRLTSEEIAKKMNASLGFSLASLVLSIVAIGVTPLAIVLVVNSLSLAIYGWMALLCVVLVLLSLIFSIICKHMVKKYQSSVSKLVTRRWRARLVFAKVALILSICAIGIFVLASIFVPIILVLMGSAL